MTTKFTKVILLLGVSVFLIAQSLLAAELLFAPNFDLQDMRKNNVSLKSYKDKQAVILFFWTTWCPFCRKELTVLNKEYQDLAKSGWEVLAINVDESAEKIEKFLQNNTMNFKLLLDKGGLVADAYGLLGVPTFIFVDKKGQVVFKGNVFPKDYKGFISI